MKAYKAKTSRQKYAKSDHYQKFKQAIYVSSVMPLYMNRRRVLYFCRKCIIPTLPCLRWWT